MANTDSRATRSATTRESETRRKPWQPPQVLDAPTPPEGYKYRWLAKEVMGEENPGNMSKRIREGWELVRPEELSAEDKMKYSIQNIAGTTAGVVTVGGLVLAKMPIETINERNAYYSGQTQEQLAAIDNELRSQSNPTMPIGAPQRESHTTFGNPENKPTLEES